MLLSIFKTSWEIVSNFDKESEAVLGCLLNKQCAGPQNKEVLTKIGIMVVFK